MTTKKLPSKLYRQMLKYMPLICVDGIILCENRFLLVKRKNKPCKGEWYIPGGRVFKGEKVRDAFKRKMKEEIGLDVEQEVLLYTREFSAKNSEFGPSTCGVDFIFGVEVSPDTVIKLDNTSSEYNWMDIDQLEDQLERMGFKWI